MPILLIQEKGGEERNRGVQEDWIAIYQGGAPMAGIVSRFSPTIKKKYDLDKPYLEKVTVTDLKNISKAVIAQGATPGGRACQTCCCSCAAAVSPDSH